MDKRVTLKLNNGTLQTGFSVSLQIGDENAIPTIEVLGHLPAAPDLEAIYQQWQITYRQLGNQALRLEVSRVGFATNVSYLDDCQNLANTLEICFNQWLRADSFRPVQDKLLEQLNPEDRIRLIVQTQETIVQRLPWHLWDLCDRYPNLEIALSAPIYEKKTPASPRTRHQVRILAILGDSQGLDITTDLALLNHLPNADIHCLTEPSRQTLDTYLWDTEGWDILFFAGHSCSQTTAATVQAATDPLIGQLAINPNETITIPQLKNALKTSLSRGLQIAIFNSCDGLGLAQALADLQIPQILVMQEVIPDQVAHAFLKSFLDAFSRGKTFYLAVREAREKLQGLENTFPCAAWLPTIYQNPAETPPQWQTLAVAASDHTPVPIAVPQADKGKHRLLLRHNHLFLKLFAHIVITATIMTLRHLGIFQGWELKAFDQLMALGPQEKPDSRLVIVTVTEADIQAQTTSNRRGSLSDKSLLALLTRLESMQPRVIGLDIYRDFSVQPDYPELGDILASRDHLFTVCKSRDSVIGSTGIAPPPEVSDNRIGFSDFLTDTDGVLRRQLMAMTPEPASPCTSSYGLSTLLALHYLSKEDVAIQTSSTGYLQVEDVTFTPINTNMGGYQGIDDWGHQILLNYRRLDKPEDIADTVTLTEVLEGQVSTEAIRDRIVLIGTTDSSYGDLWLTPYSRSGEQPTSGVFMQAHMTSQLISAVLDDRPLINSWPNWGENLWILLWGSLSSLFILKQERTQRNSLSHQTIFLLVTELGLVGSCWLMLHTVSYWIPWIPPAILLITILGLQPITNRLTALPNYVTIKEAS